MPTCNPYFWFSVVLLLLGLGLFMFRWFRPAPLEGGVATHRLKWPGLALILAGTVLYVVAVAAYPACTRATGACPASFPPGSTGYSCTNEFTQCSWTGNCLTVAGYWPWESACECKCVNSGTAVEALAKRVAAPAAK